MFALPERLRADRVTLHPLAEAMLDDYVTALAVSPQGTHLAATSAGGTVGLLRVPEFTASGHASGHTLDAVALAWAPDGQRVATAGHDGTVRVWAVADGTLVATFSLHGWVEHLVWDPVTGRLAAAAGRAVQVWDGATLAPLATWAEHRNTVTGVHWLCSTGDLLVATYGGVWRYRVGQPEPIHHYAYAGAPVVIAVAPDGSWLVVGNLDQSIHLWPLTGPAADRPGSDLHMWGFQAKIGHLAFDSRNRYLFNTDGPTLVVWKLPKLESSQGVPLEHHTSWISALAPQPEGDLVATADEAGTLCLWYPNRRRPVVAERLDAAGLTALEWARDGQCLLTGSREGRLALWRVAGG